MNQQAIEAIKAVVTPVLMTALTAIVASAAVYVAKSLRALVVDTISYVAAKMGTDNYVFFRRIAKDVVLALMQHPAYKDLTGPEKKNLAIIKITQYINEAGVQFSTEQVSEIIEAVYAEINKMGPLIPGASTQAAA